MTIKSSGSTRQFKTGAQRDSSVGKPRMSLIPDDLMMRVALWYGLGAEKYGDDNWRLGQPQRECLDALKRHLAKWESGDKDEDHLSAVIFNALSIMNVEQYFADDEDLLFKPYQKQIRGKQK